jgi:hypothetical protein
MSNDGRSIGEHLRDTEAAVAPDSSADSSATKQPASGPERESDVTNRASEEVKSRQRKPSRGERKGDGNA